VGVPFNIGANGIALKGSSFYVTNTDKGSIVQIPVMADGSAGTPTVFVAPDCANLSGADGLTVDPDGNFIVAVNHLNKLVRISPTGQVVPLLSAPLLDFPTSSVFVGRTLYVDNFSFLDGMRPGLIRVSGY